MEVTEKMQWGCGTTGPYTLVSASTGNPFFKWQLQPRGDASIVDTFQHPATSLEEDLTVLKGMIIVTLVTI